MLKSCVEEIDSSDLCSELSSVAATVICRPTGYYIHISVANKLHIRVHSNLL